MGADIVAVFPRTGFDIKTVSLEIPMALMAACNYVDRDGYKVKLIDQRMDENWKKPCAVSLKTE